MGLDIGGDREIERPAGLRPERQGKIQADGRWKPGFPSTMSTRYVACGGAAVESGFSGFFHEPTRSRPRFSRCELAAPSVKQRLAAIRHLFDWLVTGQVVPVNPAGSVRGPRHVVTSGQTPVLDPAEARALLDSIDVATHAGLRDRALIGLMVYSFARIGAALGMTVEDVYTQNRRLWVRLREKGGKRHAMAVSPQPRRISHRLSRRRGPTRRSQGTAVPHDRARHRQVHAHRACRRRTPTR
jgi:site-specific recombinase XerC